MKFSTTIAAIALSLATTVSAEFPAANDTHGTNYPATNSVYHSLNSVLEYDSEFGHLTRRSGWNDDLSTIVAFMIYPNYKNQKCEFKFQLDSAIQGSTGQSFDVFQTTQHIDTKSTLPRSNFRGQYLGRMKAVWGQATTESGNFLFDCPFLSEGESAIWWDFEVVPVGTNINIKWDKHNGPWIQYTKE